MAVQPFIDESKRPDLTVDMESKVGDLTVRQLSEILGQQAGTIPKLKEAAKDKEIALDKVPGKEAKDLKDHKESKEQKDHKEPKDTKDRKDHKDPKEAKDQKDQKEHKDHKDTKDNADQKAEKDHKDQKDHKDHKELKDGAKEIKEPLKDNKEPFKELEQVPQKRDKDVKDNVEGPGGTPVSQPGLEDVVQRSTGLQPGGGTSQSTGGTH